MMGVIIVQLQTQYAHVCSRHSEEAKVQDGSPVKGDGCWAASLACQARANGKSVRGYMSGSTRLSGAGLGCHCGRKWAMRRPSLGENHIHAADGWKDGQSVCLSVCM